MNILSTTRVADIELPPPVVVDAAVTAVQRTQAIDGQHNGSVPVPTSMQASLSQAPEYQSTPTTLTTHVAMPPLTYRSGGPPPPGTAMVRPSFTITATMIAPTTVINSYASQSQSTPTSTGENGTIAPTDMPIVTKKPLRKGISGGGLLDLNA